MSIRATRPAALPEPIRAALAAADRAPSVGDSRPWTLAWDGSRITVSTDTDRRLDTADPHSRELVISCGAALYNARVALRAHRLVPEVALLPAPDRPGLLAEVTATGTADPAETDLRLHQAIGARRSHRGEFAADIGDPRLLGTLAAAAAAENARLLPVAEPPLVRSLAGLAGAAEQLHRHQGRRTPERGRWPQAPPDSDVAGAVPAPSAAPPRPPDGDARARSSRDVHTAGTVALVTTAADSRRAWLSAGQALQRVLLTAAADGVLAALHTQVLEEPLLRAFISERFCDGAPVHMILRLGRPAAAGPPSAAPREPRGRPTPDRDGSGIPGGYAPS